MKECDIQFNRTVPITDKQWDELLELFEVMKYDANKKDGQRRKLEKDIHSNSNKYGKGQIESAPLIGQQTARTSSLLWGDKFLSIRNPQFRLILRTRVERILLAIIRRFPQKTSRAEEPPAFSDPALGEHTGVSSPKSYAPEAP
jgi:hypothetical protein